MSFGMLLYDYHPGINLLAARLLGWLLGNCWLGRGFSEALPHRDCWMSHPEVAQSLGFPKRLVSTRKAVVELPGGVSMPRINTGLRCFSN